MGIFLVLLLFPATPATQNMSHLKCFNDGVGNGPPPPPSPATEAHPHGRDRGSPVHARLANHLSSRRNKACASQSSAKVPKQGSCITHRFDMRQSGATCQTCSHGTRCLSDVWHDHVANLTESATGLFHDLRRELPISERKRRRDPVWHCREIE